MAVINDNYLLIGSKDGKFWPKRWDGTTWVYLSDIERAAWHREARERMEKMAADIFNRDP